MEPFSITCTTCKSRLKVKSAAAVGQLVACPKCGGMVLIKLPEEIPPEVGTAATKPVEPQSGSSNPQNTKDFDDVESILAGAAPAPPDALPTAAATPRKQSPAAAEARKPQAAMAKAAVPDGPHDSSAPSQPLPDERSAAPQPPEPSASSAADGTRRYGAWLAISILGGIVMAVAVVVVSSFLLRDSGEYADKRAEQPANSMPVVPSADQEVKKQTTDNNPQPETAAKAPPVAADSQAHPAQEGPKAADPATEDKPPPTPAEDPLQIAGPLKDSKTKAAPGGLGDDPLGKFADVLEGGKDNPLPAVAETVPKTPEEMPTEGEVPVDARPLLPRPPPREVDVASALAEPLPGIEADKVPLVDFLRTMSSLSAVPITLKLDELPAVRGSAASPVTFKSANTTIGQALADALQPLQLAYAVVDEQLVVSLAEPGGGALPEVAYRVTDLTEGKEERGAELAEWILALIDPEVWRTEGEDGPSLTAGGDEFLVQAPLATHARLFLFLQRLRVARGLPPQGKHDPSLFRLATRTEKVEAKLAEPITVNFSQPTLLVQIIAWLEEHAKLHILVDWQGAGARGWNPDGETTLTVENQPLEVVLDRLLTPMELGWRAVDEKTLEVTSLAALHLNVELELHPAAELADGAAAGEALLVRLRSSLAVSDGAGSAGVMLFDPVSRCVLASLPQPQQRQIERLLAKWTTESKAASE